MGAGHGHGRAHGSGHAGTRHRWRVALAFALVAAFFVVELLAGLWSGSLAPLSDARHMAADVVALGAVLAATRIATRIATRADTTGRRLESMPGMTGVHDLHLWTLTSGMHATVQDETDARSCDELSG